MSNLVWERNSPSVILNTNFSLTNEARVNGLGPIVATVTRKTIESQYTMGRTFIVRVLGKVVMENWTMDFNDPQSFIDLEKVAESEFANISHVEYLKWEKK